MLVSLGELINISAWVKGDDGSGGSFRVFIEYDPGNGIWQHPFPSEFFAGPSWSLCTVSEFIAVGIQIGFRFRVDPPPALGTRTVYLDDVTIDAGGDMAAKVRTIKAAMISALKTITVANGYSQTVVDVYDDPRSFSQVQGFPCICVTYEETEKIHDAMQEKHVAANFIVAVYCSGPTADDDCADLAADVEKCLETLTGGTFLGLGYILNVSITNEVPFETTDDIHRDKRIWLVRVQVDFHYARLAP
jgi:hypothetical protein